MGIENPLQELSALSSSLKSLRPSSRGAEAYASNAEEVPVGLPGQWPAICRLSTEGG
jgi:hypothetical protein